MKTQLTSLAVLAVFSAGVATAGDVTGLTTFTSGTKAIAAEVNGNFNAVKTAVDDNNSRTTTNTADIATNTADIATNTADIATNTADIATNTADIATNTADIAANTLATADLCALYQRLASSGIVAVLPIPAYCPPPPPAKLVFVTSTTYTGNLGGLAGADASCMTQAGIGGLAGTFKAWLSDSTTSAASRLTQSPDGYALTTGTPIAANWADLTDGTLGAAINVDESMASTPGVFSWTGTDPDGTASLPGMSVCNDWTVGTAPPPPNGQVGNNDATDGNWTNTGAANCDTLRHLICVEQ